MSRATSRLGSVAPGLGAGGRRRTNLALAVLLAAAVVSGLVAQAVGTDLAVDPALVHGVLALAVLVLAPWKQVIVRSGLRRHRRKLLGGHWPSLLLLVLVVVTMLTGLAHATGLVGTIGPLTVMQVHVGSAVLAAVMAVDHYRRHPVRPRRVDLDRRSFLRATLVMAGAGAVWAGLEGLIRAGRLPGGDRRFTGSHERGSFEPAAMPTTSWLDDATPRLDPAEWRVVIAGEVRSLADLAAHSAETVVAVLDCTGGWHSEQAWTGIRLDRLIDGAGARSIVVGSATGYSRRFPVEDLSHLWLATAVGGSPLSPGHGFPARLVAPGRRGFWWVKWVTEVSPSSLPWWAQSPFPLT